MRLNGKSQFKIGCHILLLCLSPVSCLLVQAAPTFGPRRVAVATEEIVSVLRQARQAYENAPPCAMDISTSSQGGKSHLRYEKRYYRDGDRIDISTRRYDTVDNVEKPTFVTRGLWDGTRYFHRQEMAEQPGDKPRFVLAHVSKDRKHRDYLASWSDAETWLDGIVPHANRHFADHLLAHASDLMAAHVFSTSPGRSHYVVECDTPKAFCQVWFSDMSPHLMHRLLVLQEERHLIDGHPITSPERKIAEERWEVKITATKLAGETQIAVSGEFLNVSTFKPGQTEEYWRSLASAKRSNIRLNPDFQAIGAFQIDLDEGQRIRSYDGPERYEWHNGEVVQLGSPLVGMLAPRFELKDLAGRVHNLTDHENKHIVVLDFWETWCRPCIKAFPVLLDTVDRFRDRGVVLYTVNRGESTATIRQFLEEQDLALPVLLDFEKSVAQSYRVSGIPQTVIIDKSGTVRAVHIGYTAEYRSKLVLCQY